MGTLPYSGPWGHRHALPPPLWAGNDCRNGRSWSTAGATEEAGGRAGWGLQICPMRGRQGRGDAPPSPSAPPLVAISTGKPWMGFAAGRRCDEPNVRNLNPFGFPYFHHLLDPPHERTASCHPLNHPRLRSASSAYKTPLSSLTTPPKPVLRRPFHHDRSS